MPNFKRVRFALALMLVLILVAIAAVGVSAANNPSFRYDLENWLFPNRDPMRGDAVTETPFTPLTYSVHTFLWWDDGPAGVHMEWVKIMGFTHVKQVFAWEDIQPQPGVWDWGHGDRMMAELELNNLQVVARLGVAPDWTHPNLPPREDNDLFVDAPPDDLSLWADYCGAVAERYAGRIAGYQIWNEPNLSREWGGEEPDAARFVEMLRLCSEAIREADPQAVLISPGLSPTGTHGPSAHRDDFYLWALYGQDFQQYIDVVGAHAPGYTQPQINPDTVEASARWATFRRVEDLREIMIRNGDAARQMAILETGYTTDTVNPIYSWFAVTEEQQAEYLEAAYRYAAGHWRPWVGLMSSIYIAKPIWTPDDEEFWWAFNDPQTGRMRPVFGAMAQMEKYCGEVIFPARDPVESALAPEYNPCS